MPTFKKMQKLIVNLVDTTVNRFLVTGFTLGDWKFLAEYQSSIGHFIIKVDRTRDEMFREEVCRFNFTIMPMETMVKCIVFTLYSLYGYTDDTIKDLNL